MSLKIQKPAGAPPIPPATYIGICVGIVDMGEQIATFKEGDKARRRDVLLFIFEVAGQTIDRGNGAEPRWLSKRITNTSDKTKATLPKLMSALLGKPIDEIEEDDDVTEALGKSCLMSVCVKQKAAGGEKNDIDTFMQLPAGTPSPAPIGQPPPLGKTFAFDIDDESAENMAIFAALPEWMRKEIEQSRQWKMRQANTEELPLDRLGNAAQGEKKPARDDDF